MKLRSLSMSLLLSLSAFAAVGCADDDDSNGNTTTNDENEIVNVAQTDVERQSIGNCWLYAHATWIESMNLTATGQKFDISQSYWTYWHWFDQIAGGYSTEISTGGNWTTANNIIKKYGLMAEADFVFADTQNEMSDRQKTALAKLNTSLKTGALKDAAARRDKKKVRAEMDAAWGLTATTRTMLDNVFGPSVTKTLSSSANATGTKIIRPQDFAVSYSPAPGQAAAPRKLTQAMSDWRQVYYYNDGGSTQRNFLLRVQKALHAAQPVVITWFVDFNAMENGFNERRGSFNLTTLNNYGPGSQGGHMTVLEDYQAQLADGTLLAAGKTLDPTKSADRALLARALEPSTKIQFLRVKNSWGSARPDRAFAPNMPGYHDLYLDYLNGPVKRCTTKAGGETDTSNCPYDHTPLQNVVLPPGY
jgi:hypothetical protein